MTEDHIRLLHAYIDGAIGEQDFARLEALLRESAEARRALRNLSTVHSKLQQLARANAAAKSIMAVPATADGPHPSRQFPSKRFLWTAAVAASVAFLVTGVFFVSQRHSVMEAKRNSAFASTEEAIARLSPPRFKPLPDWISPTSSVLHQPGLIGQQIR